MKSVKLKIKYDKFTYFLIHNNAEFTKCLPLLINFHEYAYAIARAWALFDFFPDHIDKSSVHILYLVSNHVCIFQMYGHWYKLCCKSKEEMPTICN